MLEEAVDHLAPWNEWFERKAGGTVAATEHGEVVSDDEVRAWMDGREHS